MNRKFNRNVSITIARPLTGTFFQNQPNAIVVKDLKCAFEIEKHTGSDPNTCEISIFNLNSTTRAELQRKPLHIIIEAGYDGDYERLFVGDLRYSLSNHQGVDWTSKLQVGDGERAFKHARVRKSYRGGVNAGDAVREVATTMGLTLNPATRVELAKIQHVTGLTLSGQSNREMTRLLSPHGYDWSIQDGRLQILKPENVRGEEAIVISAETGLIGSPEFGAPEKEKKTPKLNIKHLLIPRVSAGSLIQIISKTANGNYKAVKVKHSGDTHGADFVTEIEAIPR